MKIKSRLIVLLFTMPVLLSGHALAFETDDLVEARQGLMNLYAINMNLLGEMIRGNIRYDQKKAQYLADNLYALARMNNSALWKSGTSMADQGMKGKTWAKPELWQNRDDVSYLSSQLTATLEVLSKNAGWSVDALEENIVDVNAACKECHRYYLEKK